MPDVSPKFQKITTECCDKTLWLLCSRIDSIAYTEEGFLELYEVDEETKSVTRIGGKKHV